MRFDHGTGAALAKQLETIKELVREMKKKYTYATSGCADAGICCDEILAKLEDIGK